MYNNKNLILNFMEFDENIKHSHFHRLFHIFFKHHSFIHFIYISYISIALLRHLYFTVNIFNYYGYLPFPIIYNLFPSCLFCYNIICKAILYFVHAILVKSHAIWNSIEISYHQITTQNIKINLLLILRFLNSHKSKRIQLLISFRKGRCFAHKQILHKFQNQLPQVLTLPLGESCKSSIWCF